MEVDSRLTYVVPRGTVVFRVETYSVVRPPYLFYAYFGGNLKQQFMAHKRAWVSRCANSNDPGKQVRVVFMRLTRDVELLEMSMNNYNYDEPTDEEVQALHYLEGMARVRLDGAPQEMACVIDALRRIYNAPQDGGDEGADMIPDGCPTQIDYTVASFVYSHLKVDGWIRLDKSDDDNASVALDEVMLVRRVLDASMESIGEYQCSLLDIDAPPPDFMTDDYVQPSIYRRQPISRRTRSTKKGTKSLIGQIQLHNDAVREMTMAHDNGALCLQCEHPCSRYENGEAERPFCSRACQLQTGLYDK